MAIKILTQLGVDNTNIDGARDSYFNSGMRSGIVQGAFNEGRLFASSTNEIALDSCELRIAGHRVVIDSVEAISLLNKPSVTTRYSMIAQIIVNDSGVPTFSLFTQNSNINLIQEDLYALKNGSGTYQVEIGTFTLNTNGEIIDVVRTIDLITGGAGKGVTAQLNIGNVTTTTLDSGLDAEVDVDSRYDENTGKTYTDFHFSIPEGKIGQPNNLTVGIVESGEVAKATITGDAPNQVLNLTLPKGDKGDTGDSGSIQLDDSLSATSENAVKNKVITEEFNKKANKNEIPYLPIGTIIQSAIPLDDAGVLLLAGQTIAQDGIYADFVSLVKNKVAQGYPLTCTEEEYTNSVNTTGNCGKFVINNTANTLRIPRITRFVQGLTNLDTLSDIGESESAGLPNITGSFQLGNHASTNTTATGAFTSTEGTDATYTGASSSARSRTDIEFNASDSSSIYGNSDTVQPESTKFPYYIVVANTYKTDTQVNIDNIVKEIERLDTECVKTTGVQTISGDKNFTGQLLKGSNPIESVLSNTLSDLMTTAKSYVKLESGLTIQWFTAKLGSNTTVTFPTNFMSTNYAILGTPVSTDSSNVITFKIRSRTTTSFAGLGVWCASNSQGTLGSDITFAFIAIGY